MTERKTEASGEPACTPTLNLEFQSLHSAYRAGDVTPEEVMAEVLKRIAARGDDGVWIYRVPESDVQHRAATLAALDKSERDKLPLFGLPFSVKDCIDIAGLPTTAACPAFSYIAEHTNLAVQKAIDAGAILIGKTNMDQFATGVVGVRSPYGIAQNPFDASYIPGGSSSGAAVSVSAGLCSFGLGTDTGGSGRVPASYNNIVGLKPTLGLLSKSDMVNANRHFDTVSIYTLTAEDADLVLQVCQGVSEKDPFGRVAPDGIRTRANDAALRIAIPDEATRNFFGNTGAAMLFQEGVDALAALGHEIVPIDFNLMFDTSRMLFDSAWVAERYLAVGTFIKEHPDAVHPVVRQIILRGADYSAADAFRAIHSLREHAMQIQRLFNSIDVLAMPTVGTVYRIDEVLADPVVTSFRHGYYTNFASMADLAAIAIPNGFLPNGVPMGISLMGPAFSDQFLTQLGSTLHRRRVSRLGAYQATENS